MAKLIWASVKSIPLYGPSWYIFQMETHWMYRVGLMAGYISVIKVLYDIRGLLLHPKEARMELDPEYKAKMERDGTVY